jgi:hypothetical protein
MEWVTDRKLQGIAVSPIEIRLKASQIAKKFTNMTSFKASYGWATRFINRHGLSIRRRTTISQALPQEHEKKLEEFQKFVTNLRKKNNYELSQIGNADQTPLTFDLLHDSTAEFKGSKTVNIKTTGHEKSHFTVMLACTADGGKLPPYIIFKRKTMPKTMNFPTDVEIRVQGKGWMDETLVLDWLKTVWGKMPNSRDKSLLVLDSFRCHRMPSIQKESKKMKLIL